MALTPGIVPALNYCVRAFTSPGEAVIIQTPVYYPFFSAIENNGRRTLRNSLRFDEGRFTMDVDDLRRKISEGGRMLILCSPHNPVGRVWTRDELEAFVRINFACPRAILAEALERIERAVQSL